VLLVLGTAAVSEARPVRVAVAPFEDEPDGLPVAQALAGRLARRPIQRLIAPDASFAKAEFEPTADRIRRWAHTVAVDAIVVGRLAEPDEAGARRVEAILRSGHSGAELARHSVAIRHPAELGASAEILAAAILQDLGYEPPPDERAEERPLGKSRALGAAGPESEPGEPDRRRGLDAGFQLPGSQSSVPTEIKAEEAEIIDRSDGRRLVFRRDVWVRQGDLTLRSDWLEALYDRGESDPKRLVARGSVKVDQGDRRAECDEATYLRLEQTLTCVGHAVLVQGCDVVRGERIEFDLAGDRAQVEGGASILIRSEGETGSQAAGAAACVAQGSSS
jgi:lipopolysaccharide export system protein LptA